MNLYLDSSALLKRYLEEDGRDLITAALGAPGLRTASRLTFVETMRGLSGAPEQSIQARRDWPTISFIELSEVVCERAVSVAERRDLKTLDAIHLASALVLDPDAVVFATFDRRLHAAARAEGFETLPAALG